MASEQKQLKVVIGANAEQLNETLKKVRKNLRTFSKSVHKVGDNLKKLASISLAPLAGGLTAAGAALKSSISAMVSYGGSVDDAVRSLGVAGDALQTFRYAAEQSGSSAEEMDGAIAMLNKNIANAANGKNKDLIALFKRLGISMKDSNGNMKTAAELMPELADAIASQKNQTQKAYIANLAFGRSGQNLIKTLAGGSKGLDDMRKEAEKFGIVMSDDDVAAATEFGDSMTRTRYAVQGVQNSIGSKLLPVLQPMLDQMNDWIAENREWLATTIADAVKDLSKALKGINFKTLVTGTISFVKATVRLFNALGGLKTVAAVISAVFAGKVIASFAMTGVSLVQAGVAFWNFAKNVGAAIKFITIAMAANPIGLILVAISAAIAAIYANWDTIGPRLEKTWGDVCKFFTDQWELVKNNWSYIWDLIKAKWEEAKANFDAVCKTFSDAWDVVCKFFSDQWDQAKANFDAVCKGVSDIWDGICKGVQDAWDSVVKWISDKIDENVKTSQKQLETLRHVFCDVVPDAIVKAWEWLKEKITAIIDTITAPIKAVTDTVGDLVSSVGGTLKDTAKGAWNGAKSLFGFGDDDAAQGEPAMASGGVVTRPTHALIGEAGPEAVLPLDRLDRLLGGVGSTRTEIVVKVQAETGTAAVVERVSGDRVPLTVIGNRGLTRA